MHKFLFLKMGEFLCSLEGLVEIIGTYLFVLLVKVIIDFVIKLLESEVTSEVRSEAFFFSVNGSKISDFYFSRDFLSCG